MSRKEETATRRPDLGGRSTVFGTRGAVACEHPSAALTGLRVLDDGGTAADACVAMAAAMAVLSPMQTGMGGDAFLLFYEAETGRVTGVDGSGQASRALTVERLLNVGEMPQRGGLTVTVPELAVQVPRNVPAYSLVTAPDFYPNCDQRELIEWWTQRVPTALRGRGLQQWRT